MRYLRGCRELTPFQKCWNKFWMYFRNRIYLLEYWLDRRCYKEVFLKVVKPTDERSSAGLSRSGWGDEGYKEAQYTALTYYGKEPFDLNACKEPLDKL